MRNYILKRLVLVFVVLMGVSLIVFLIMHLAPGDPVRLMLGDTATEEQLAAMRVELGYDRPLIVQYFDYILGLITGDWGTSLFYKQPVLDLILGVLGNTLKLTASAMIVALIIAIPLGIVAGVKRGSAVDMVSMGFALLGQSLSPVWLGILLVLIFSVNLGWLPAFGDETFANIILPSITLGTPLAAVTCRMVRAGMIDTLEEDYILVARAKGTPNFTVITKYALKNVMIPVITIVGLQVGTFLGGAVVTEQVFAWNGIGRLMVSSITKRDYPVVIGCLLICSFLFVMINFAVDMLYMLVDPRLRTSITSSKRKKMPHIKLKKSVGNVDQQHKADGQKEERHSE